MRSGICNCELRLYSATHSCLRTERHAVPPAQKNLWSPLQVLFVPTTFWADARQARLRRIPFFHARGLRTNFAGIDWGDSKVYGRCVDLLLTRGPLHLT